MKYKLKNITKVGWGFGLCNQNCIHCYNSSSLKKHIPTYTFPEMKSVADRICSRITDINFGTGEFFVNPNTSNLLRYIKKNYPRVKLGLTSNGYSVVMLSDHDLKKYFHDVDISVDFPDKKKHNAFRRHPLAWDWVTAALEKLKRTKVSATVTACANSLTTDKDLAGLLKLADKYGAYLRINWFRKTGRGKESLRLSPVRAWQIIRFLSRHAIFCTLDSIFAGPLNLPDVRPCPACTISMRIHENMSVTPAPYLKGEEWSAGNILHDDIGLDGIHASPLFTKVRNRQVAQCAKCPYWEKCRSGCITRAILHSGGLDRPDDFCPINGGVSADYLKKIKIEYAPDCDLVHNGYLCTTIVKSK